MRFVWVVLGAALGATARYLLGGWIASSVRGGFPWGTLVINLIGCLAIGWLWGCGERFGWTVETRAFIFAGILASFTTFSSFGLETVGLVRGGAPFQALAYVALSNAGGLLLVWVGTLLSRPAG
ncbi:MAG TPA: fluoride efflux transporter CrcB [Geobacteraceae bacterium]